MLTQIEKENKRCSQTILYYRNYTKLFGGIKEILNILGSYFQKIITENHTHQYQEEIVQAHRKSTA